MNDLFDPPAAVRPAEDMGELAQLAKQINEAHEASGEDMRRSLEHRRNAGKWLLEAQEDCQRRQIPWTKWLKDNVAFTRMTANNYMRLASGKCKPVLQMPLREVLEELVDSEREPTHTGQNSGDNEWHTPPEYIAAARKVLGAIDLDPASSPIANETVQATLYYVEEDSGQKRGWKGRVWLNPPYARPLVDQVMDKLCEHYAAGDVPAAIALVNNATETSWFGKCAHVAAAICFPARRVKFLDPEGKPGAPLQGQAVIYLGDDAEAFRAAFEQFGPVWKPFR
jgi:ParB family chromosome partitioning protein